MYLGTYISYDKFILICRKYTYWVDGLNDSINLSYKLRIKKNQVQQFLCFINFIYIILFRFKFKIIK